MIYSCMPSNIVHMDNGPYSYTYIYIFLFV